MPGDKKKSNSRFKLSKKDERLLNKKRKWKAFLDVCKANDRDGRTGVANSAKKAKNSEDEEVASSKSHDSKRISSLSDGPSSLNHVSSAEAPSTHEERTAVGHRNGHNLMLNGIQDELRSMRAEISHRKSLRYVPTVNLSELGLQAQFQTDETYEVVPLFVSDLKHLLLVSVLGHLSVRRPRWCTLTHCSEISHVTMVVVDGLSARDYRNHSVGMKWMKSTFDLVLEVLPSQQFNTKAIDEVLGVVDVMRINSKLIGGDPGYDDEADELAASRKLQGFFNIDFDQEVSSKIRHFEPVSDKFPRTRLLLCPEQMITENYPFPLPGLKVEHGFVFTKDKYAPATPESPLFGVDCEMCLTESGESELTRISIVNELLDITYHALVKPRNKIVNYLTRFSGIRPAMLRKVDTRIEDVQKEVHRILPSDAILCGQSLNMDLRAMKMLHPYVIDTSVIFNLSGVRRVKASLKNLTKFFLKKDIQNQHGHNPVEDSRAALQLVQLKLANSIDFGDVIASPTAGVDHANGHNRRLRTKNVCVISSSAQSTAKLWNDVESESCTVSTVLCKSNKEVSRRTRERAIENDLTIAHIVVSIDGLTPAEEETKFSKLDSRLRRIYDSCAVKSLFIVMFADSIRTANTGHFENELYGRKFARSGSDELKR